MRFKIKNSCALITGASAGLGVEFARQIASSANTVILVARREERLKDLAKELKQRNPELQVYIRVHDLLQSQERTNLVAWIKEEQLSVNLLINNAGMGDLGGFFEASWIRVEEMMILNMIALTHMTHLLLPLLRKSSPSAILNVGSIASFFPLRNNAVYAASKAYVRSFSEGLRREEKVNTVTVTLVCPGPVPTEFFDQAGRGEYISIESRAPHCFITSPEKVVQTALKGVEYNKAIVIPNILLSILVNIARFLCSLIF